MIITIGQWSGHQIPKTLYKSFCCTEYQSKSQCDDWCFCLAVLQARYRSRTLKASFPDRRSNSKICPLFASNSARLCAALSLDLRNAAERSRTAALSSRARCSCSKKDHSYHAMKPKADRAKEAPISNRIVTHGKFSFKKTGQSACLVIACICFFCKRSTLNKPSSFANPVYDYLVDD